MQNSFKNQLKIILYAWRFPRDAIFCLFKLKAWNSSWRLYGLPLIQSNSKAVITIGKYWTACSSAKFNSIGVFQKVIIKALNPNAVIKIGNNVGMSGCTISCSAQVTIGNNVLIGSGVLITDTDAHAIHYQERNDSSKIKTIPVLIEDDVFIGARSIILKGVTIGMGSVVGAGSVVVKNVPSMVIVGGNPAKIIGSV